MHWPIFFDIGLAHFNDTNQPRNQRNGIESVVTNLYLITYSRSSQILMNPEGLLAFSQKPNFGFILSHLILQ
jgi:hypothetical protein